MIDHLKIVGAHGKRRANDFYPTPPECTVALCEFLEDHFLLWRGSRIWEPACGDGAMVRVFEDRGYTVIGTDIMQGQDYLTADMPSGDVDWIITNPPFCLAQDFIRRSVQHGKPFALLLKSQYWHSAKRHKLFASCPPTLVLPLTWRPDFTGEGASLLDMMWCVWLGDTPMTQYIPLKKPSMES